MKFRKLILPLLLFAYALTSLGATLNPVQLLNPAGSTSGQAVLSTGASSAPAWGNVTVAALAAQAANTVVANVTGSSASPTAFAMPSCSTSASALNWTTSTGFTCNIAVNAAQLGGATFASPGAIGGTTAGSGAFTTLSASSTISGAGFSTYLASPPAIGGTAAAAGSFTTLSASSTVSGAGFSTYLASPPAIGGTAAAAGSFTTLAASGNDALYYTTTNALSLTTGTATTITTWTKAADRVNANFNASTGVFTAPATGYYQVDAGCTFNSAAGVVGTQFQLAIVVNGGQQQTGTFWQTATTAVPVEVTVSGTVNMTAGQTLVIQAFQNSGATRTLDGTAARNFVSIVRLP